MRDSYPQTSGLLLICVLKLTPAHFGAEIDFLQHLSPVVKGVITITWQQWHVLTDNAGTCFGGRGDSMKDRVHNVSPPTPSLYLALRACWRLLSLHETGARNRS